MGTGIRSIGLLLILFQGSLWAADIADTAAWSAWQAGRWAEAEAALSLRRQDWAAQMAAGVSAYRQQAFDRALRYFRQAAWVAEDDHRRAQALMNLGNVFYRMKQFAEAVETYEEVLRYRPDQPGARRSLIIARNALQYARARARLQRQQVAVEEAWTTEETLQATRGRHQWGGQLTSPAPAAARVAAGHEGPDMPPGRLSAGQVLQRAAGMTVLVRLQRRERLRQRLQTLQTRRWTLQRRLFEREAGFEAAQDAPHAVRGVPPW